MTGIGLGSRTGLPSCLTAAGGVIGFQSATLIGGVDGQSVSSFTDRLGNQFDAVNGAAATLLNQGYGGQKCLMFNASLYRSRSAALVAAMNGSSNKAVTCLWIGQPTFAHDTTSYFWGWGNSTAPLFSAGLYMRTQKSTLRQNLLGLNNSLNVSAAKFHTCKPTALGFVRANGNTAIFSRNGVFEAPIAAVDTTLAIDSFVLGGVDATAPLAQSQALMQHCIQWDHDQLGASEWSAINTYFRYHSAGLSWKAAMGATLPTGATNTYIFLSLGQSNEEASPGLTGPYPIITNASLLALSGFVVPLQDPIADNTNQVQGSINHRTPAAGLGNVGGSSWPRFLTQITSVIAPNPVMLGVAAQGSTASDAWANGVAQTNPPNVDTLIGNAMLDLYELCDAPSPIIAGIYWNDGQSNAVSVGPTQPAFANRYLPDWQSILDMWEALAVTFGVGWLKPSLHYIQTRIAAMNAGLFGFQTEVIAAQNTLQTNNASKMVTITQTLAADDPNGLHESQSELDLDADNRASTFISH